MAAAGCSGRSAGHSWPDQANFQDSWGPDGAPHRLAARAMSGRAAAVPLRSVMNSRRLMSDMGLPPAEE